MGPGEGEPDVGLCTVHVHRVSRDASRLFTFPSWLLLILSLTSSYLPSTLTRACESQQSSISQNF